MPKEIVFYQYIYNFLLSQICSGYYKKGEYLPPFEEICKQFNTSVITVRKAVQLLSEHGYIRYLNSKHYIVTYDGDAETTKKYYIDQWCAKQQSIKDLFDVFILLMPSLICQAAIRCNEQQLQSFKSMVDEMDLWNHSLQQITQMRIIFFRKLLGLLNNELLDNLYQQSINFIYIPFIPSIGKGAVNFFEYEYLHVQKHLFPLIELMMTENYREILENTRVKYVDSKEKTEQYICELTKNDMDRHIAEIEFYWYTSMDNSSLVSEIAMQIIFDKCNSDSLPPISKLAKDYNVSKQTVLKAIDVLRNMGMACTNMDNEVQLITEDGVDYHFCSEDKTVRKGLIIYLCALQIIVIIVKDISKVSFPYFTAVDIVSLEEEFKDGIQSPQKILQWIIEKLPNRLQKNLCAQLLKLSIHGLYLNYPTQSASRQVLLNIIKENSCKVIHALKLNEMECFCDGMQNIYQLIFRSSKKKMIALGIDEAKKICEPDFNFS